MTCHHVQTAEMSPKQAKGGKSPTVTASAVTSSTVTSDVLVARADAGLLPRLLCDIYELYQDR
jgi:hypothetical protein